LVGATAKPDNRLSAIHNVGKLSYTHLASIARSIPIISLWYEPQAGTTT